MAYMVACTQRAATCLMGPILSNWLRHVLKARRIPPFHPRSVERIRSRFSLTARTRPSHVLKAVTTPRKRNV